MVYASKVLFVHAISLLYLTCDSNVYVLLAMKTLSAVKNHKLHNKKCACVFHAATCVMTILFLTLTTY